jgi:NitT/TauT family transport system substrate-binding protein
MKRLAGLLAVMGTALAIAACGEEPASEAESAGQGAAAGNLESVTVRTAYQFNAYDIPLVVAKAKGFYEKRGLDVTVGQGTGSSATIATVASGRDDFGATDMGTTVTAIANQDVPVKTVGVYLQKTPMGFIHKGDDFDVSQLPDRTVISSAGAAELTILPAVLERAGLSMDDINVRLVNIQSRVPLLLRTSDAVLLGFATGDLLRAQIQDESIGYESYTDHGIQVYGIGLIANRRTIESEPDKVRAFVEATTEGWQYTLDNPEESIDLALEEFPDVDRELLERGLEVVADDQVHTEATADLPLGVSAEEDWKAMTGLLTDLGVLKKEKPLDDYYTNEFATAGS